MKATAGPLGFMRSVGAEFTRRKQFAALAMGIAFLILRDAGLTNPYSRHFLVSGLVIVMTATEVVLIAAIVCDEAIRRGAKPWLSYVQSLAAASIVAAVSQWYLREWLHLFTPVNRPGIEMAVQRTQMVTVVCDVVVFGGFAMLAYLNRRSAQRIVDGVRSAELRRIQIERQLTESRMAAAQAQIDPQLLFESLTEIRNCYATGAPQADRKMNELIGRLQTSVTGAAVAETFRSKIP